MLVILLKDLYILPFGTILVLSPRHMELAAYT